MPDYDKVFHEVEKLLNEARDEGRQEILDDGDYGYCPDCDRGNCDDCDRGNCEDCDYYSPDSVEDEKNEAYTNGWNEALRAAAKQFNLGDYLDSLLREE